MTNRKVVIALDDTDMPGTRGTGKLARDLAAALEREGLGMVDGVTRHQFWVGPGVPFTSHNSALALGVQTSRSNAELAEFAKEVMAADFIEGSDPGLAVLDEPPPAPVAAFARRAQNELVTRDEAEALATEHGLLLLGLAGTRDGMIGALSAAALRFEGNDGRFVAMPAIRDLLGLMKVADILSRSPIDAVLDEEGSNPLPPDAILDTRDWVRPRLVQNRAIVFARRTQKAGVWVNADKRAHEG